MLQFIQKQILVGIAQISNSLLGVLDAHSETVNLFADFDHLLAQAADGVSVFHGFHPLLSNFSAREALSPGREGPGCSSAHSHS